MNSLNTSERSLWVRTRSQALIFRVRTLRMRMGDIIQVDMA